MKLQKMYFKDIMYPKIMERCIYSKYKHIRIDIFYSIPDKYYYYVLRY